MKLLTLTVALMMVFSAAAKTVPAEISVDLDKLKLINGAVLVEQDNVKTLKLVSKSAQGHPKAEINVELDKSVTYYILSYSVKTENIVSVKPDMYGADIILKPAKGGALRFSSRGSYKCDVGTTDWKKVTHKINTARYLKEQPVKITLRVAYAAGTAWYKDVKLSPVLPKK